MQSWQLGSIGWGARNLWSEQPLASLAEDVITGLEFLVDPWVSKIKTKKLPLVTNYIYAYLPDEYSDQNLKMKRRDFCLELFCQFFGSGLPSTKLQAKVVLLFLILP